MKRYKSLETMTPGPGSYYYNEEIIRSSGRGAIFGKSQRHDNVEGGDRDRPGPGDYNPSSGLGGRGHAFGRATGRDTSRDQGKGSPGPGYY